MKLHIVVKCPHCGNWGWVVNPSQAPDHPTCFSCAKSFKYQELEDYRVVLGKPSFFPLADESHVEQQATSQDIIRWYYRGRKH